MSRAQRIRRRRRGRGRPRNKALLALVVVGVTGVLAGLSGVGYIVSLAASAPPLSSLTPRNPGSFSSVYSRDGHLLGVIEANDLRKPVPSSQIPQVLRDATVAIEDERFYRHKGVDYEGVLRAAVKNATSRKTVQGGSTITMQLIRNRYISGERTYQRKIKEAKLAEELEKQHSKAWILNEYINTVPYGTVGGQSAIGAWAAARIYFDKPVQALELHEAALLAGLPQAPTSYSPVRSESAALNRRNEVLEKMADVKLISDGEARAAIERPLGLKLSRYFSKKKENFFFDYVKDQLFEALGSGKVRLGGMRIRTTLDLKMQRAASGAINRSLAGVGPSGALVTIDPANGEILAMASNADYGKLKYNLAAQGHRQPGSAFKTMALMTAVRRGIDPDSTSYTSRPLKFKDPIWGPIETKTFDNTYKGRQTLTQATLRSDNTIFMQLALDLGPKEIKQTAYDMGIETHLDGYPAETLGGLTIGVSPLEMANAYATIASGGWRNRPVAITSIRTPDGEVLEGNSLDDDLRPKRVKAFPDGVTAEVTRILEMNVSVPGTGGRAQTGCPVAGKTGTTDKHSDAWFAGFTPKLATAVWVGYPARQVFMTHEFQGGSVQGGTFPAIIWSDYMKQFKRGCPKFAKPKEPMTFTKFFGKYATTGKALGPEVSPTPEPGGSEAPAEGGGKGKSKKKGNGNGGGEFDPTLYESPPQPAPTAPPPAATPPPGAPPPGAATPPPP